MARNAPNDARQEDERPRRKRGGVPLWAWVLIGGAGLGIVGVFVVCAGLVWVGNKARDINQQPATADNAQNPFGTFKGFCDWCDAAAIQVGNETRANANRGETLRKTKATELNDALLGKQIEWRVEVTGVVPTGIVVDVKHFEDAWVQERFAKRRFKSLKALVVFYKKGSKTGGTHDQPSLVTKVPPDLLQTVSTGNTVTMRGTVEAIDTGVGGWGIVTLYVPDPSIIP